MNKKIYKKKEEKRKRERWGKDQSGWNGVKSIQYTFHIRDLTSFLLKWLIWVKKF